MTHLAGDHSRKDIPNSCWVWGSGIIWSFFGLQNICGLDQTFLSNLARWSRNPGPISSFEMNFFFSFVLPVELLICLNTWCSHIRKCKWEYLGTKLWKGKNPHSISEAGQPLRESVWVFTPCSIHTISLHVHHEREVLVKATSIFISTTSRL